MDEKQRKEQKKIRDDLSNLKRNEEIYAEGTITVAKLYAERFFALIDSGFTREEALQIVVHRGLD